MDRINARVFRRIAAIILAVFTVCSLMGCSAEKIYTTTETYIHTVTDANKTTAISTNHNGEITTETTNTAKETRDAKEEGSHSVVYKKVPYLQIIWDGISHMYPFRRQIRMYGAITSLVKNIHL